MSMTFYIIVVKYKGMQLSPFKNTTGETFLCNLHKYCFNTTFGLALTNMFHGRNFRTDFVLGPIWSRKEGPNKRAQLGPKGG